MDYLNPYAGIMVTPDPGYVLKGMVGSQKIFLNICSSPHVPGPAYDDHPNSVRIPMSIGPLTVDVDGKKQICSVIDVIVGMESLAASLQNDGVMKFIVESVESKYKEELQGDIDNVRVIKKKYKGDTTRSQRLRAKNTAIQETSSEDFGESDMFIPTFTMWLEGDIGKLDVLTSKEYQSTQSLLKDALQRQISGGNTDVALDTRYTSCLVSFPNVFQPEGIHLDVSDERLCVRVERMEMQQPISIWFPKMMDPESATATYTSEKRELCVRIAVA